MLAESTFVSYLTCHGQATSHSNPWLKHRRPRPCGSSLHFEFIRDCMKINKIRPCLRIIVSLLLEPFGNRFIDVIDSTTQNLKKSIKRLPNGSRSKDTVNNKTKPKGESFSFLFLTKMEFTTHFVYFHTFSYKFKVSRTPTEPGWPVVKATT